MPVTSASCNQIDHILDTWHSFFLQAFNVYTLLDVFANMQVDWLGVKQVHDLFVVNLKVTGFN